MNAIPHPDTSPGGEAALLLLRMLSLLRRSRETPLQFEIDSAGIVAAALMEYSGNAVCYETIAALNSLINQVLSGECETSDDISSEPPKELEGEIDSGTSNPLPLWLRQLYQLSRQTHPQAIDLLALRLEGYGLRDASERLDIGLRLAQRILQDVRASWKRAAPI